MASAGNAFSQTLQEITTTKLDELSKRYAAFESTKASVLVSLTQITDPVERLESLSEGIKRCLAIKTDKSGVVVEGASKHRVEERKLKNFDRFFVQARYDPSVSLQLIQGWEDTLLQRLDMQSLKFQYASLYGKLVTEWLSLDHGVSRKRALSDPAAEPAAKKAKTESRQSWVDLVFTDPGADERAMTGYLQRLFAVDTAENERVVDALQTLRKAIEDFEIELACPGQFTKESLIWAINGLLASGLITGPDLELLRGFKSNPVVLAEIADVLNMRLAALESWCWGDVVKLEQTRKISGVYNIHMHEDILQALFLQLIGVKWSVFLKGALQRFRSTAGAWKPMGRDVPPEALQRLRHFVGGIVGPAASLNKSREDLYSRRYFMAHLLNTETQESGAVEGEEEAQYTTMAPVAMQAPPMQQMQVQQQMGQYSASSPLVARRQGLARGGAMRHRKVSSYDDLDLDFYDGNKLDLDDRDKLDSPMALKQKLLHLLSTEIEVGTRLHGELTALHLVFRDWNPRLPHATVLSVLDFLGVSPTWKAFFAKFLKAPLQWADAEEGEEVRTRQRGAPASHALSDVFGEAVLFCLDFAVNRETNGNVLWRVHDDAWFWSTDHQQAVKAWATVNEFVDVAGVSVDERKAGTVRVSANLDVSLPIDPSLPSGSIRWGFLALSPQTGRFEIDQTLVDAHVADLRRQLLGGEKSVFSFVQTWNSYAATFFSSNFGVPANCFGRRHVDKMLETHNHIQKEVFSLDDEGISNVADYLRKLLYERFGVEGASEGFFYFPAELGGLDLKSPFVTLLQIRDSVLTSSEKLFDKMAKSEREAYENAKANYANARANGRNMQSSPPGYNNFPQLATTGQDTLNFPSFEEYTAYREELNFGHDYQLANLFCELLSKPEEQSVDQGDDLQIRDATAELQWLLEESPGRRREVDGYLRWVLTMYGPEVWRRFGGLSIVEQGLLPMGMVSIFKESRVEWQG